MGAVVLFAYNDEDLCGSAVRCDLAAASGAIGCLLYNVVDIIGMSVLLRFAFQMMLFI